MAVASLAPIDWTTLAYLAVALAFNLWHGPHAGSAAVLLPLGLAFAAVLAAVIAPRARQAGPFGRLLAEFYPLLLAVGFYTHVGLVNAAAGTAHDALVQRWEALIFSRQPSLDWIRVFPSPAWSTLMHGAYLSYYLILAGAPLGLWMRGRRAASRGAILAMMVAFYLCYTIFLVFPVAGPRYSWEPAVNAATAVPAAVLTHHLLGAGSAWGTAFPSSHVAVALVAAACAWRGWRALGACLLPLAVLLALGTVYAQLHYAVDAIAGAALALAVLSALPAAGYDAPAGSGPKPPAGNGAKA